MPDWSPQWAPWVTGSWPERVIDPETGEAEVQLVQLVCSKCSATFQVPCTSGAVRKHVQAFALVHSHRQTWSPVPSRKP